MKFWYLSHRRTATAQATICIRAQFRIHKVWKMLLIDGFQNQYKGEEHVEYNI